MTLAASEPAAIYYTTDGTTPTASSTRCSGAINVTANTTLKFFAADKAGNKSAVATEAYTIDGQAPVAAAPNMSFPVPSQLAATAVPTSIKWAAATDAGGSGLDRYELQRTTDGGTTWTGVALPTPLTTEVKPSIEPGITKYQYRVRAFDKAGNASAWKNGQVFEVGAVNEGNASIAYTGTWTTATLSGSYGGSVKHASAAGTKAVYSFTGKEVSWATTKGANRGRAEVWLDGAKVADVDLYAGSTQARAVVFSRAVPEGAHKLEIRVLGTKNTSSSGPRADVDAFATRR